MEIRGYNKFKQTFNALFKKYHPDNSISGNAEKFIKYKTKYDRLLSSNAVKNIHNIVELDITTTQAFNGCELHYDKYTIKVPKHFYNDNKYFQLNDEIKLYINIIPEKDETINFINGDLMVTKNVHYNIFDIILGKNITLNVFGEKYELKIKPYELLKRKSFKIPKAGYPQKNKKLRNDLTIKFLFDSLILSEKDIFIIKEIKNNYGKC